jgi:hypothetical protein
LLRAAHVSAVLVTRGDVDLEPILASLPFADLVVWDNSQRERDLGAFGRYAAIAEAKHEVIYTQDDDLIVQRHDELLAAWEEGMVVANMPAWKTDYLDTVLIGYGSLFNRSAPQAAFERYARFYEIDDEDFYRIGADFVFPLLTPFKRGDFGIAELPYAHAADRTYRHPDYRQKKQMYLRQARRVRRLASGEKSGVGRLRQEALAWSDHARAELYARVLGPTSILWRLRHFRQRLDR